MRAPRVGRRIVYFSTFTFSPDRSGLIELVSVGRTLVDLLLLKDEYRSVFAVWMDHLNGVGPTGLDVQEDVDLAVAGCVDGTFRERVSRISSSLLSRVTSNRFRTSAARTSTTNGKNSCGRCKRTPRAAKNDHSENSDMSGVVCKFAKETFSHVRSSVDPQQVLAVPDQDFGKGRPVVDLAVSALRISYRPMFGCSK